MSGNLPPLPPGATLLDTEEAIRRIKERDHVMQPGRQRLSFQEEEALIGALGRGAFVALLLADGQLAFTWVPGQMDG